MLVTVVIAHLPMRQFGWFVPFTLMPLLTYHFALQALLARWLARLSRWPAVIILPLCVGAGRVVTRLAGVRQLQHVPNRVFSLRTPGVDPGRRSHRILGTLRGGDGAFRLSGRSARFKIDGPESATPRSRRYGLMATVLVMLFLPPLRNLAIELLPRPTRPAVMVIPAR